MHGKFRAIHPDIPRRRHDALQFGGITSAIFLYANGASRFLQLTPMDTTAFVSDPSVSQPPADYLRASPYGPLRKATLT